MRIKLFLTAVAVGLTATISTPAFAQESEPTHPNAYNRISLSYRNVHFSAEGSGVSYNGGSFDYIHGFSVSKKLPIYVQTGASLGFTTKDTGSGAYGGYATIDVPVSAAYRFEIPNTPLVLLPYLGLDFKGNIIGTSDVASDTQEWFSKYDYRRFQLGWNLGVGLLYKKLYFGLGYGTDFIQIAKKVNTGTFQVSLGLNL